MAIPGEKARIFFMLARQFILLVPHFSQSGIQSRISMLYYNKKTIGYMVWNQLLIAC